MIRNDELQHLLIKKKMTKTCPKPITVQASLRSNRFRGVLCCCQYPRRQKRKNAKTQIETLATHSRYKPVTDDETFRTNYFNRRPVGLVGRVQTPAGPTLRVFTLIEEKSVTFVVTSANG